MYHFAHSKKIFTSGRGLRYFTRSRCVANNMWPAVNQVYEVVNLSRVNKSATSQYQYPTAVLVPTQVQSVQLRRGAFARVGRIRGLSGNDFILVQLPRTVRINPPVLRFCFQRYTPGTRAAQERGVTGDAKNTWRPSGPAVNFLLPFGQSGQKNHGLGYWNRRLLVRIALCDIFHPRAI